MVDKLKGLIKLYWWFKLIYRCKTIQKVKLELIDKLVIKYPKSTIIDSKWRLSGKLHHYLGDHSCLNIRCFDASDTSFNYRWVNYMGLRGELLLKRKCRISHHISSFYALLVASTNSIGHTSTKYCATHLHITNQLFESSVIYPHSLSPLTPPSCPSSPSPHKIHVDNINLISFKGSHFVIFVVEMFQTFLI